MLDATVGGGGHAGALLSTFPELSVIGLDQDAEAVAAARSALSPIWVERTVVQGRFDHVDAILDALGVGNLLVLCSTSVSAPSSSIRPNGVSATGSTRPWTCAWTALNS